MTILEFDRQFPRSRIVLIGSDFKKLYDFIRDFIRKNPGLQVKKAKTKVILPNGSVLTPCVPGSLDLTGLMFDAAFIYGSIPDMDELDSALFPRVRNLEHVYQVKE